MNDKPSNAQGEPINRWQLPSIRQPLPHDPACEWAIVEVLRMLDANAARLETELFAFMREQFKKHDDDDDSLSQFGVEVSFRLDVAAAEQALTTLREVASEVMTIAGKFGSVPQ